MYLSIISNPFFFFQNAIDLLIKQILELCVGSSIYPHLNKHTNRERFVFLGPSALTVLNDAGEINRKWKRKFLCPDSPPPAIKQKKQTNISQNNESIECYAYTAHKWNDSLHTTHTQDIKVGSFWWCVRECPAANGSISVLTFGGSLTLAFVHHIYSNLMLGIEHTANAARAWG